MYTVLGYLDFFFKAGDNSEVASNQIIDMLKLS